MGELASFLTAAGASVSSLSILIFAFVKGWIVPASTLTANISATEAWQEVATYHEIRAERAENKLAMIAETSLRQNTALLNALPTADNSDRRL